MKILRRRPDEKLRRLVVKLDRDIALMDDLMGDEGLGAWFIPILLAITAVAGLVGSVGIAKYIGGKVPELSQDQIQSGIKVASGLCLVGIGLYTLKS